MTNMKGQIAVTINTKANARPYPYPYYPAYGGVVACEGWGG